MNLGTWYSLKTLKPVDGFLGPNGLKQFRVEIDYVNSSICFERGISNDIHDMDIIGITLRLEPDSNYKIIGIAKKDNQPVLEEIESDDILISIDDFKTKGATMGNVFDALRGNPGDIHVLTIERKGNRLKVKAKVSCLL